MVYWDEGLNDRVETQQHFENIVNADIEFILHDYSLVSEMNKWCEEHCKDSYYCDELILKFSFKHKGDAIAFKLIYGSAKNQENI